LTDSPCSDSGSPHGGRQKSIVSDVSHLAFVALGANLADPLAQLRAAAAALAELPESRLLQLSSLYRTAPVGIRGQPDFINAVAAIETVLDPQQLLDACSSSNVASVAAASSTMRRAPSTSTCCSTINGWSIARD
jgi:7,8-dihydro-6-hydroxymethylpterin-pyrophosphokinase